jgi:hypothetical protein
MWQFLCASLIPTTELHHHGGTISNSTASITLYPFPGGKVLSGVEKIDAAGKHFLRSALAQDYRYGMMKAAGVR